MRDPILFGFASVVLLSFVLLVGSRSPRLRRPASVTLGVFAVLFACLAFWQVIEGDNASFGAFLVTSLALGNFGIVLQAPDPRPNASS